MYEQVFAPKSANWNEVNTRWVTFPNGKQYMLPVVGKAQKLVPHFDDDGKVRLEVRNPDPVLGELVEAFLKQALTAEGGSISIAEAAYGNFISLVRALLAKNYAFSNDELQQNLTTTVDQFQFLYSQIIQHIR